MQQNKNNLSELISDWEASQIGLSERSEIVWDKLESALENKGKKKWPIPFLFAAASILIIAVSGIYFFQNDSSNDRIVRKNNKVSIKESSLEPISSEPKFIEGIIVQKKKSTILVYQTNQPVSSLASQDEVFRDTIHYQQKIIEAKNITSVEPVLISTKTENVDQEIEKPNYWKQYKSSSKIKFGYQIVHINDLNPHAKQNTLSSIIEEKSFPNFEIPPPNETKHKWKITLHANSSPISLSQKE
ncbi:MAG: hypothetical protein C0446_14040 [Chitinophaga sp.]|nr:hypothetical protein [Chitinophaga sp.]